MVAVQPEMVQENTVGLGGLHVFKVIDLQAAPSLGVGAAA